MKTLKINIPEGMEIDKENSTFEEIVFKHINIGALLDTNVDKNKEMSDFLFNMFKETTTRITGNKETTHFNSKGDWLMQVDYKNGYLWVRYNLIWRVFETRFGLKYGEISKVIKEWIEINIGLIGLIPKKITIESDEGMGINSDFKGLAVTFLPINFL